MSSEDDDRTWGFRLRRLTLGLPGEVAAIHAAIFFMVAALTPSAELLPNHADVVLYFQYAERMGAGEVPYRDIPLEYPPAAVVAVALPYLVWPLRPPSIETYQWLFAAQAALLSIAAALVVGWCAGHLRGGQERLRSVDSYTILTVILAPLLAWRFDLLPAVLGIAGVALSLAGRPSLAGAAIGLGFAAKVFPVVLLPVLALYFAANRGWLAAAALVAGFVLATAAVALPVAMLAPNDFLSFAVRQQERPVQIESLQGGVHLLAHLLFGMNVEILRDFGSVNIITPGSTQAIDLQPLVVLAALGGTFAVIVLRAADDVRRHGHALPTTLIEGSAAVLLALVLTNKVFSPQYMVWLLPFAALLRRPHAYLVATAAVLTMVIFPLNYERLISLDAVMIIVLNLRNALLAAVLVMLLFRIGNHARSESMDSHRVVRPDSSVA